MTATATDPQAPPLLDSRGRLRDRLPSPFGSISGFLILLAILSTAYPAFRMLLTLFWQNGHLSGATFEQFAETPEAAKMVADTAIVVGVASVISVLVGGAIAWLNERTDARMGMITDVLPFMPFLTPAVAGAIGWVVLLAPTGGLLNAFLRHALAFIGIHLHSGPFNIYSYPGLIFVYSIYMVPFAFLTISVGLRNMDAQLEEQSRICRASFLRTLRKVTLPAIAPSIAAAILLVVWTGFGMYAVPATIAQSANIPIMTVSIVNFLTAEFPPKYGPAVVLSFIIVGFVAIAWYVQTRVLRRSHRAMTTGRGRPASRSSLGRWKWPIRVLILVYISVVTILPGIGLILVVLNGYWAPNIHWDHLSFAPFVQAVFDNTQTWLALKDSFELGFIGAFVGTLLAAIISVTVVRSRRRAMRVVDGTIKLPVVISHLVLAIGFLLAFAGPPFRLEGTLLLLLVAYTALCMPQGTLVTDAAAAQVGMELNEASRISGAGNWRTFRKVYLPLMLPSLAIGWALIFVRIISDLEISEIVSGPDTPTIGTQTLSLYNQGTLSGVAALSLILLVVTAIVVVAVMMFARHRNTWAAAQSLAAPRVK